MMDETALQLIQDTAIDANGSRIPPDLYGRLVALPTDYVVHDLEKYMDGRERFRGALRTDSLADFISYVKRRAGAEPLPEVSNEERVSSTVPGFIDADKLSATVLFNLGTVERPGHADDTAQLALKASAPYTAALAVNGRAMLQKDAIDWLEDWNEHVEFAGENGDKLGAAAAIAAIRRITITSKTESTSSQDQFRATRSALEDVEARGAQALPSEIHFTCVPYAGLPSRTLRLRLAVLTSGDKPQLVLRVRNLEAEREAIAQDFKRVLLDELEDVATLTIGTFTP